MAHKSRPAGAQYIGKSFIIENYRVVIEKLLDEGGYSIVYKVNANDGKTYALKRITTNTREEYEVYLQEISIMRMLTLNEASNCVHLVAAQCYSGTASTGSPIQGVGVHELYLLMELCFSSVHTLMTSKLPSHLTEVTVFEIFYSTCLALLQLHSMDTPIIHRDIKIENILINSKGRYVLCDFGSALIGSIMPSMDNRSEIEEEINKYTTMDYRAPEMVNLYSGYEITTKADIWALGVLLYKLCYRKTPFGDSKLGILSGKFFIPSSPIYSKNIHNLIYILLNLNAVTRPDIHQVIAALCKHLKLPQPTDLKLAGKEELDIATLPDKLNTRLSKQSAPAGNATPQAASTKSKFVAAPITTSVIARSRPGVNSTLHPTNQAQVTPPLSPRANPRRPHTQRERSLKPSTVKNSYLAPPSKFVECDLDKFGMTQFCPAFKASSAQELRGIDLFGSEPFVKSEKSSSKVDIFGSVPFSGSRI